MHYKVGTRGSKLALKQTEWVIETLKASNPRDEFEIVVIETTGDKNQVSALDQIGSKGVFVDTIEQALLSGEIQLAVHSMKDMPEEPLKGLVFTKPLKREDARDAVILKEAKCLNDLPEGARIGTGSLRRKYQLLKLRPDLNIVPIRGNIDTRIKKLHETNLDGIVLAAAGLKRIGREDEITQYFNIDEMIPAPAQGTLALEVKEDNYELISKINELSDFETDAAVYLERGFLQAIGATCHDPVGAYGDIESFDFVLKALFGREDGSRLESVEVRGKEPQAVIDEAVVLIRKKLSE